MSQPTYTAWEIGTGRVICRAATTAAYLAAVRLDLLTHPTARYTGRVDGRAQ